jgi:hypothetical protein
MVVGFNHNVMYKGEVFHIQTEDSGIANPHIITLVYRGGTILASKKTSYADIIKIENLEQVVEDLMKEQHKGMMRNLKAGHFDQRAFGPQPAALPLMDVEENKPAAAGPAESPPPSRQAPREVARSSQSLDEVILDYLVRGEDR